MLLAIDTSTRVMGLALFDGQHILYESAWSGSDYHTVDLAPTVHQAMSRVGMVMEQLQAVGVATGPGSFTGLRVGMAFSKGLVLANRLPIIGVPTLEIVARAQPIQNAPLIAIVQAGRGNIAAGWYHVISGTWQSTGEIRIMRPKALAKSIRKPTVICGELNDETRRTLGRKYKNAMIAPPALSLRRPGVLAELAWERWKSGKADDPAMLAPFYLHKSD